MHSSTERIKLPSNPTLVTPESIWKYLIVISKTGYIFNKEQLIKNGLYTTNDNNLSRNLSYLKYLALIDEDRIKGKEHRYHVIESKNVRDILHELKAGREENAKISFRIHLQSHALFATLKNNFFLNERVRTLNDLEHFLKDSTSGTGSVYYQKGSRFIARLLKLVNLISMEGNEITLTGLDMPQETPNPGKQPKIVKDDAIVNNSKNTPSVQKPFSIKIQRDDMSFEMAVKTLSQLELVLSFITSIKYELMDA